MKVHTVKGERTDTSSFMCNHTQAKITAINKTFTQEDQITQ